MRFGLLCWGLLLLLSLSYAPLLSSDTLNLALWILIPTMALLLIIVFMFSESLSMPQLHAWAKGEIRELIVAVLLYLIVFGVILGSNDLVKLLTGNNDLYMVSENFFSAAMDQAELGYTNIMSFMHYLTLRSSLSLNGSIGFVVYVTYTSSQQAGLSIFLGPLNSAAQGLVMAWMGYAALAVFFEFMYNLVPILLPVAFIFRFIPFTRQLGNTLIALTIGAKILLPLAIVLVSQFHGLITAPDLSVNGDVFDSLGMGELRAFTILCSNIATRILLNTNEFMFSLLICLPQAWIPGWFMPCMYLFQFIWYIADAVFKIGFFLAFLVMGLISPSIGSFGTSSKVLVGILLEFLKQVNNFGVLAFIDLIVVALITYSGIKSISAALGGDQMMTVVSRLVR